MNAKVIESADWNFDGVPDGELVACCYWEYARESAFLRNLRKRNLEHWIPLFQKRRWWNEPEAEDIHRDTEKIRSIGPAADIFLHGFACPPDSVLPDALPLKPGEVHRLTGSFPKPWQVLTKEEREYRSYMPPRGVSGCHQFVPFRRAHCVDARDIIQSVTQQRRLRDQEHERVRRQNPKLNDDVLWRTGKLKSPDIQASVVYASGTERTVVEINWGIFTNEEIIKEFRKWVKANRPHDLPKPDNKGHKPGDWRAHLTRLAVMRLLARFTPLAIVDPRRDKCPAIWNTEQFSRPKWRDVTKWYDARREARKLFHSLFPFLPKDEKPRSWNRQPPAK